ncbi:hypothetical protein FisN_14Lh320 [Fistulifera solaris]|uniref:Uncharacterized protein n=1 Tax=Fistulifera solaris TaxID=1519565 RepID=A0A1Z5JI34_FISSO|nr:hypothetical protein FisN_14Lh320 [Fistulifera solaris]|eukprot:GAX13664.1 hypothetical protein FisN_14Lh320 [Fistulifera solaris]
MSHADVIISGSGHDPYELSYQASSLDKTGRIISKEKKRAIREKEGYCLTCPGTPSKLFEIKKSRLNPLWIQKKPQTIEGQSLNGWCVKCNPALNRDHNKRELTRKDALQKESDHSGRSGKSEVSNWSGKSDASTRSFASTTSAASFASPSKNFITVQAPPAAGRTVDRAVSESCISPRTAEARQDSFHSASKGMPRREYTASGHIRSPHGGIPRQIVRSPVQGRQSSLASQEVEGSNRDTVMERQSSLRNFNSGRPGRLSATDRELSFRSIGSLGSCHSFQQDSFKDRYSSQNSLGARQSSHRSFQVDGHSSFRSVDSADSFSGHPSFKVDSQASLEEVSNHNMNRRNLSLNQTDPTDNSDDGCRRPVRGRRFPTRKSLEDSFSSELTELPSTSEESHIQIRNPVSVPTRRRATRNPSVVKRPEVSRHLSIRTNSTGSMGSFESDEEYIRQSTSPSLDNASLGNVENLLADMIDVQDPELIIDVLIESMDSHVTVQDIQCLCIGRIAELSADTSVDCTRLFTANGHKSITAAMNNFPNTLCVQERSLEALANLALRENTRAMLLQEGACTLIDSALHRYLAEEKMVAFAIKALRALSCDREGAKRMDELGISETVVEVMHCNMMSVSIQTDGCSLLSNLAVDVVNQNVSQVDRSTIMVIEAAMREHQQDATVQASACFALKNLSFEQSNLRMISKSESMLELLMKAQEFAGARTDAMLLIERIQISSAEDQSLEEQVCESIHLLVEARSGQSEIVDDLVETMRNYQWSEAIASTCIDILVAMVTESAEYKKRLSGEKQIDCLEMCARSSTFSEALVEEAQQLLGLVRESM